MHKKIAIITMVVAGAATINAASAAKAQLNQPKNIDGQEARQQIQAERIAQKTEAQTERLEFRTANKEKMLEEKCKKTEARIQTRIGRYENNQQMLQTVYGNMLKRLDRLVTRLTSAGADTTKLKTDLATLKTMIDKLYADNATFVAGLKTTQTAACGTSEGEFVGKLGEARKVLPAVKADRAAIKTFFNTTIKADLKAIRTALAAKKAATQTEVETETEAKKIKAPKTTPTTTTTVPTTTNSTETPQL